MKILCARVMGCAFLLGSILAAAQVAVPTYQYDNYRSGTNTHEHALNPASVNVRNFGHLRTFPVEGAVYAQPLYVPGVVVGGVTRDVLFVATEHDQVYAFDVSTGQQLWHANFLSVHGHTQVSPVSSDDVDCPDLVPEIGITGTPAIDTSTNTIYVMAETKEHTIRPPATNFYHTLHALDIRTGLDKTPARRVTASAQGIGTGSVGGFIQFNSLLEDQRPGLLIADGQVFVSWASHCDRGSYHGWLMAFDESTLAPSGVFIDTPNGYWGGFWGSGSGPAADADGSIYAPTGNGDFSANSGGIDYGDSIVRLTWSASGLTLADYFTPWDQQTLNDNDTDVASGGVVLLPDQPGSNFPHLLVQAGKEGTIDLVNRDDMGHFHSADDSQIVQTIPHAIGPMFGGPAFWNNKVYFGGVHDHLKAFDFNPSTQLLSTVYTSETSEAFQYPGPTPTVSSDGLHDGIAWIVSYSHGYATLHAYNAENLGVELYNSNQDRRRDQPGLAVKFSVPTVADGRVFVGGVNEVAMYGLLSR